MYKRQIEEIAKKIQKAIKNSRVLIFDAVNNEDIIKISKAVIHSNINIVTVDPGPFTLYYSRDVYKRQML